MARRLVVRVALRARLEPYLGGMVGQPPVSLWTARALILLGVLVIGWLIAGMLGYFLRHSALSVLVDRILGLVFGTVRGAVVIAVFVMLGEFVELNQVDWWKRSHMLPYASELAELDPELRGNGHENRRRRAIDAVGSLRECAESSASSAQSQVNQQIYDALTVLQHRGQDAAGIMTCDEGELFMRKQNGLVRDVFQQRHMLRLKGNIGIGHVRYPTAGCDTSSEAQPFFVNSPYGICLGAQRQPDQRRRARRSADPRRPAPPQHQLRFGSAAERAGERAVARRHAARIGGGHLRRSHVACIAAAAAVSPSCR